MVDRLEFALYANIICCKRISSYLWKSPTEIIFLDNLCNQLGLRFWIKQDLHQQKNNQIIYLNIFCRNLVQFSNLASDELRMMPFTEWIFWSIWVIEKISWIKTLSDWKRWVCRRFLRRFWLETESNGLFWIHFIWIKLTFNSFWINNEYFWNGSN